MPRTNRTNRTSRTSPDGRTGAASRTTATRTRDRRRNRTGKPSGSVRNRPPGRTAYRRALRREAPTVVALILDDHDFLTMTGYRTFPFDDYGRYLQHLDGLLRSLHAQGTTIAVTHFDPDRFAAYCADTRRPPDSPAARVRYTAEVTTTGPAVPYARQPLALLRTHLAREADRHATRDRAADLLAAAGQCPDCPEPLAHCAFDRAAHTLLRLLEGAGPGDHHLVCSLPADAGPPLLAAARITDSGDGELHLDDAETTTLCTVMAAAEVTTRPGGLVLRTTDGTGTDTVHGWSLHRDGPRPLTEAAVFDAYCTEPETGDAIPPEPGVRYRAGFPLPPPLPGDAPHGGT